MVDYGVHGFRIRLCSIFNLSKMSNLDEKITSMIKEEHPTADAVKSLINVRDRKKGKVGSDIELKTDLDKDQVCIHTAVDMMTNILEMQPSNFNKKCVIGDLVNLKERKLLSLDRKSRTEIVEIARHPDLIQQDMQSKQGGFVSRLFSSRKNRVN